MHFIALLPFLSTLLILSTARIISHDHKVGHETAMAKAYHFSIVTEHKVFKAKPGKYHRPVALKTSEHNGELKDEINQYLQKEYNAGKLNTDHGHIKQTSLSQNKSAYRSSDKDFQIGGSKIKPKPVKEGTDKGSLAQNSPHRKVNFEHKQKVRNATVYSSSVANTKNT